MKLIRRLSWRLWAAAILVLTIAVVAAAGLGSSAAPRIAQAAGTPPPDSCGYPTGSSGRPATVFNESEVLINYTSVPTGPGDTIKLWYNDEHALTLGVRQQVTIVKTSSGTTTTTVDYPFSAMSGTAYQTASDSPVKIGDPVATDPSFRPIYPALFITDLGVNPPNGGDWQQLTDDTNPTAIPPNHVYGQWKGEVRTITIDQTKTPPTTTVTTTGDADPPAIGTNASQSAAIVALGGDAVPAGTVYADDNKYTAEAVWEVDSLGLVPGHTYRVQFMAHDGDQNKVGGDVGEACTSIAIPATHPSIATTLSAPAVAVNSPVHDSATLSGATTDAGGTVTYTAYTDNTCTAGARAAGTVNVTNRSVPDSNALTFATAGSYYWQASYSGDLHNDSALSPCVSEQLSVVDAQIKISPLAPTNEVGTLHLFTATVKQDTGTGTFVNAPDGTLVTFSITNGPGTLTPANGHCTTTGGTCTVSLNSTQTGITTLQATTTFSVGGVSLTRTTGDGQSGDSANALKTWVQPSIGITKNPKSQTIASGSTATFTIVVTNTGPVTLTNVHVGDANAPGCAKTSADIAALASMAPNASVTYTCTLANVTADFTNSATATGTPVGGGPDVSATDTAPVTVTHPSAPQNPAISITKNPKSQTIASGSTASFTIVVTNTGDVTLTNVNVTDPLAPSCNQTSASIAALASMAPGASVTYNCSLANVTASFTNVATATGTPPSGPNVTATDSAPVTVTAPLTPPLITPPVVVKTHPAIAIVKAPQTQSIATGGTATFKITVTNTGDVTLSNVKVTDPRSPGCNRNLGTLAVGQSKSYTCTRTNVTAAFQNVATVTGKPPTGQAVKAVDQANVKVAAFVPPQHPRIHIVKSPKLQTLTTKIVSHTTAAGATKTVVTYGTATFKITVTNTGDVTLTSVKVNDPRSPGCNRNIGRLAPGKSKSYTCRQATVRSNYTNIATATGKSPKGVTVKDVDRANVKVTVKTTSTSGAKFTG